MTITYYTNTKTGEQAAFLTKDVNTLIVAMNRRSQGDALVEEVFPDNEANRAAIAERRYADLQK